MSRFQAIRRPGDRLYRNPFASPLAPHELKPDIATPLEDAPMTAATHMDHDQDYLTDRGYSRNSFANCLGSIAHFAQWVHHRRVDVQNVDEAVVGEFLDGHLPSCRCIGVVQRHRHSLSAALGHLLVVLRAHGVIAPPIVMEAVRQDARGRDAARLAMFAPDQTKSCRNYSSRKPRSCSSRPARRPGSRTLSSRRSRISLAAR